MFQQLKVFGIVPRGLPTGNIHGIDNQVHLIPGTRHCEDLHHHLRSNLLFGACEGPESPRWKWNPPAAHYDDPQDVPTGEGRGGLIVVDPKTLTATNLILEGFQGAFVTLGIDIIDDPQDPSAIYIHAINNAPAEPLPVSGKPADRVSPRIEIFRHVLHSKTARHLRTVYHPLARTPNDIYSISPGEMLVTNDHKYRSGLLRTVEDIVSHRLGPKTDLIHLHINLNDPQQQIQGKIALSGLHNCNGLGHGPHGEILLTDAAGGILHICTLDPSHRVRIQSSLQLDTTIDNPSYYSSSLDSKRGYLLAGLTQAYNLPRTNRNPQGIEPTIVWYIPIDGNQLGKPKVLFKDDGHLLRSASVAVLVDDADKVERWLFVTGSNSEGVIAVKVQL